MAAYFGTDHHELHISGTNVAEIIERLIRRHDEPFGDSVDIPCTSCVSRWMAALLK